jgi:hypothetical protein
MDCFAVIKHPLDQFSFSGNVGELDPEGRASLETLMQLIGDMRFLKGTAEGACARYFLLVDLSWVPRLCLSARINCVKLREHLWRYELEGLGESQDLPDDRQIALPFADAVKSAKPVHALKREAAPPCAAQPQLLTAGTSASKPQLQTGERRYRNS